MILPDLTPTASDHAGVVAVVKFNGTLLTTPHNITTYVSTDGEAGTQLLVAQTAGGLIRARVRVRVSDPTPTPNPNPNPNPNPHPNPNPNQVA